MSNFNRILCPVDLSENSLAAIDLATSIAQKHKSKLCFFYAAPQWLPEEAMLGLDYTKSVVEEREKRLRRLRPTANDVQFEHQMVFGNAAPEIVRASATAGMIVMSTHGYSGLIRFVIGGTAQYVLRNSKCPVILFKPIVVAKGEPVAEHEEDDRSFITTTMHHVASIHEHDSMIAVVNELQSAGETAAPVVDGAGQCIGILTTTDIEKYQSLKQRYEAYDQSVVEEMFEVDKYGQRRSSKFDFDQVKRHMTKDAISIGVNESVHAAAELIEENATIHHLVVLDGMNRAVGIVDLVSLHKGPPSKIESESR